MLIPEQHQLERTLWTPDAPRVPPTWLLVTSLLLAGWNLHLHLRRPQNDLWDQHVGRIFALDCCQKKLVTVSEREWHYGQVSVIDLTLL